MSQRGSQRERAIKAQLVADGWLVIRAAGSLGVDLLACRPTIIYVGPGAETGIAAEVRVIEVKSTAQSPFEHFGPKDREHLIALARLAGGSAWLAWWPPRGRLRWIAEREFPVTRKAAA